MQLHVYIPFLEIRYSFTITFDVILGGWLGRRLVLSLDNSTASLSSKNKCVTKTSRKKYRRNQGKNHKRTKTSNGNFMDAF